YQTSNGFFQATKRLGCLARCSSALEHPSRSIAARAHSRQFVALIPRAGRAEVHVREQCPRREVLAGTGEIGAQVNALHFLGGVMKAAVPDNLKVGIDPFQPQDLAKPSQCSIVTDLLINAAGTLQGAR